MSEAMKLTPDASIAMSAADGLRAMFLEVDCGTEGLSVWRQKTASYLQLAVSGEFAKKFRQSQFRVLVVANSERRLTNIRATIPKSTDKIFCFPTFDVINRFAFSSPFCPPPSCDHPPSLLQLLCS